MKKLFIDYHKRRTQVALVEDGELVEFQVERQDVPSIVGAIYKGKVVNLIKGMKAAFVNIGLERNAFLYCGESTYDNSSIINKTVSESQELKVSPGDEIMCQVVKEEFGNKGARISTNVSIPGRLLVYVPNNDYVGISRKIEEEEDRARLEKWANDAIKNIDGGVIMRTSSRNASEEQLNNELNSLIAQWKQIVAEYPKAPEFAKLYDEGSLIFRMVRDLMDNDLDSIVFNDEEFAEKIRDKIERVSPKPNIVEVYNGTEDFFSYYGLSSQIDKMLKRKVVLKNGAYLIIDRTEALITIDVNTGKFVGENDLEETVFETNKLAAVEIAKQLRLRNLGGIIIVDFIDMYMPEHREKIIEIMKQAIKKDRVKTTVVSMTNLGLLELTRKKTRSMIDSVLLKPCPYCNGNGFVYSEEHVINKISAALKNTINDIDPKAVLLTVNPEVFARLFTLRYLEKECQTVWRGKRIYVVPDPSCHIEEYNLKTYNTIVVDLPNNAKLLY